MTAGLCCCGRRWGHRVPVRLAPWHPGVLRVESGVPCPPNPPKQLRPSQPRRLQLATLLRPALEPNPLNPQELYGGMPRVRTPKIVWCSTSRRVLTMEWIEGVKLTNK
jgi:hypothetical protein